MRGTGYAIFEIILWLAVAALIGIAIGWLIRGWSRDTKLRREADARVAAERNRITGLETSLAAAKSRAEDLDSKLSAKASEADGLQGRVAALTGDLEAAGSHAAAQEATVASSSADLDSANARVAELTGELESTRSQVGELQAAAGRFEDLEARAGSATADLGAARARISELEEQVAAGASEADRFTSLEADAESARAQVRQLEAQLAVPEEVGSGPLDAPAAVSPAAAPVAATPQAVVDPPDKATAAAKVVEIAARTRGGGPSLDDDLKRIHGVGPKLERLLKGLDITSFRQVSKLEADDIAYVTAALDAFPGRIERDDWMSSAAEEHHKKYGESV